MLQLTGRGDEGHLGHLKPLHNGGVSEELVSCVGGLYL